MKTSEIISALEKHLALPVNQRGSRTSEQLMGWAMVQLKEGRNLVREVVAPSKYVPAAAVNIEDDKRRREFIA